MSTDYYGSEALPPWYQPHQPFNAMAGMPYGMIGQFGGSYMMNAATSMGYTPYGYNFGGNAMTSLNAQRLSRQHDSMLRSLAPTDQAAYQQLVTSAMGMAGFDTSGAHGSSISRTVGLLHDILPNQLIAMAGDKLTGGRSAYALGYGVFNAGRNMIDPVTGYSGVSADSSAEISRNLFNHFYGADSDPRASAGVGSMDMGTLYGSLAARGLLKNRRPRAGDLSQAVDSISASDPWALNELELSTGMDFSSMARDSKGNLVLSSDQQAALQSNSAVQRVMRNRSTDGIKKQLEGYAGAVSAVRELFGDAGNPNAPMEQLFASLEILTSNTLQQMTPEAAKQRVQSLRVAAQESNVGLPGLEAMATYSGQLSQSLGLNPMFNQNITMQGLGMREYLLKGGMPNSPAWGLATVEQQGMRAQQRAAAAASSSGANRLGLLMRLESMGALTGEAAAIANDIRAGGVDPSVMRMSDSEFANMIAGNNSQDLNAGTVGTMMRQRSANEEFVYREGIDGVVFEAQRDDMMRFILGGDPNSAFSRRARSAVRGKLGRADNATAAKMAQAAGHSLVNMSQDDMANRDRRNDIMAQAMFKQLEGTAYLASLGDSPEAQMAKLRLVAEDMYGEGEKDYRRLSGNRDGYLVNELITMSPEAVAERKKQRKIRELKVKEMDAMLGTVDPSVTRRIMKAIGREGKYDPSDPRSLERVFGAALNAEETTEVLGRLTPLMNEIADLEKLEATGELTPEQVKDLEAKKKAAAEEGARLREIIEAHEKDAEAGSGDEVSGDPSSAGGSGGGPSSLALHADTIHIAGKVVTDATSDTVKVKGAPRGTPPNAGMA